MALVERLERLNAQARARREQERGERQARRKQQWLARLGWSAQPDASRQEEDGELLCAECGHPQGAQPGPSQRDLKVCAVCVHEEDHELRDESAMCRRARPS
ncbi:hypothetical protein GCM10027519_33810 [Kineococcus endophyticus]